jgi:hypothetical protein
MALHVLVPVLSARFASSLNQVLPPKIYVEGEGGGGGKGGRMRMRMRMKMRMAGERGR